MEGSAGRSRRLERGVAAVLWGVPLLLVVGRCAATDALPFVSQRGTAPWIMAPAPVSAELQQWGRSEAPLTAFRRRFQLDEGAPAVTLELRALGDARVRLDGEEVARLERPAGAGRGPVSGAAPLPGGLRAGVHELVVEVRNARGPALLSLRGEGLPGPLAGSLATGPSWTVRVGEGSFVPALRADDTRTSPLALAVETPAAAARRVADTLLLLFTAGAVAFLVARRRGPPGLVRGLAVAAPVVATAAWMWLYAKTARIPLEVGFDARHHLQYLGILLDEGRLPLAAEGWSTYHPPLFYAAAAGVAALGGGAAALKAVPLLAGLGSVWVAWLLARRLRPEAPGRAALAALFAATLPVNLYSAAYFSNEAPHAFLAGAALTSCAVLLLGQGLRWSGLALAALLFGLAALTKFTVLVTVPVALFFLAWKLLLVQRAGPRRSAAGLALFAGVFALVAGWFYVRSWLHYGTPLVGNWSLPGADQVWWQQPGFHTFAWYAKFGEALVHPYFSGFHSFGDALYSTFWGDGFVAGRAGPTWRHSFWDYDFMTAGYWVALPASALLLFGGVRLAAEALGSGPPERRLALGFLLTASWAVFIACLSLTLELPFFTQAKAAYVSMLIPVLALAFAEGFATADDWLARRGALPLRALLYGWLAVHAGTLFLGHAA